MKNIAAGLLPMFTELIDNSRPQVRPKIEKFADDILDRLETKTKDIKYIRSSICCTKADFEKALKLFKSEKVDTIVTLHLTYSPSLESAGVLKESGIPIIILNTTPVFDLGPSQDPVEVLYNHGIHGVQDFCSVLTGMGKKFLIESGHWEKSDVLDRIVKRVRQAKLASSFISTRIGQVQGYFNGMGDFRVPCGLMEKEYGFKIIKTGIKDITSMVSDMKKDDIEAEEILDRANFTMDKDINRGLYHEALKVGLALRRWIEEENLTAVAVNAATFSFGNKLPMVPFLEASKLLARGLGYAGEGDILTASLTAALASVYPDTTFTETFSPDWKGGSIFLNHIGEGNYKLVTGRPKLIQKKWHIADTNDVVVLSGTLKPGHATLVNLAPTPGDNLKLTVASGKMMEIKGKDNMEGTIHGWFKPTIPLEDFLSNFGRIGATHHSVLVYGDRAEDISQFGYLMGWEIHKLESGLKESI